MKKNKLFLIALIVAFSTIATTGYSQVRFGLRGGADVSVLGGHVIWYLYNREIGDKTIDIDKAMELSSKFLKDRNYKNMKQSYYMQNEGIATINYAYNDNNITYYPDLIKVKEIGRASCRERV